VLETDDDALAVRVLIGHENRHGRGHVLVQMARRKLRGVLELTELELDGSPVRRSDREAPDVRETLRVDRDDDTGLSLARRLSERRGEQRPDRQDRNHDPGPDEQAAQDHAVAAAVGLAPVPVLPGAWRSMS